MLAAILILLSLHSSASHERPLPPTIQPAGLELRDYRHCWFPAIDDDAIDGFRRWREQKPDDHRRWLESEKRWRAKGGNE